MVAEQSSSQRWVVVVSSLLVLFGMQAAIAYALRNHLYFNDDFEQLARAVFFDDLYIRQLSVHLPMPALLSNAYLDIVGHTHLANRSCAALVGMAIAACIYRLVDTLCEARVAALAGLFAGLVWLSFVNDIRAFTNVSQLYSAAFAFAGLAIGMQKREHRVVLVRPVAVGAMWACACLSRVLVVEQLTLTVLAIALGGFRPLSGWTSYFSRFVAGGLGITAATALVFRDRLSELWRWTILHNFQAKGGSKFRPDLWVGDLGAPNVRDMYLRIGVILGIALLVAVVAIVRNQRAEAKSIAVCAAIFCAGWLAANPSGIGTTFLQTIAAFPALAIVAGLSLGTGVSLLRKPLARTLAGVVAIAAVVASSQDAYARFVADAQEDADRFEMAKIEMIGEFIKERSEPTERLFIFGSDPYLYATAQRASATFASIIYNDLKIYEARILEQLVEAPPKFIVMNTADKWFDRNLRDFPRVASWILQHYALTSLPAVMEKRSTASENTGTIALDTNQIGVLRAAHQTSICAEDAPIHSERVDALLSFDTPNRWAEAVVTIALQPSRDVLFKITSSNAFGTVFSDPGAHLRLLMKDREGRLSWYWFAAANLAPDGTIEVALSQFRDGVPIERLSDIVELQVGGWGDKAHPVNLASIAIARRAIHSPCGVAP